MAEQPPYTDQAEVLGLIISTITAQLPELRDRLVPLVMGLNLEIAPANKALGAPTIRHVYIAGAGTYTTNGANIVLTANFNVIISDGTGWSYVGLPILPNINDNVAYLVTSKDGKCIIDLNPNTGSITVTTTGAGFVAWGDSVKFIESGTYPGVTSKTDFAGLNYYVFDTTNGHVFLVFNESMPAYRVERYLIIGTVWIDFPVPSAGIIAKTITTNVKSNSFTFSISGVVDRSLQPYFETNEDRVFEKWRTFSPLTIEKFGTSFTEGLDNQNGTAGIGNNPSAKISATPTPKSLKTICNNIGYTQITVNNRGYSGGTVSDALTRWANVPAADISFIEYGANEGFTQVPITTFKANLEKFILMRLALGDMVVLEGIQDVINVDEQQFMKKYNRAIQELAARYNLRYNDIAKQTQWLGYSQFQPNDPHKSPNGYAEVAPMDFAVIAANGDNLPKAYPGRIYTAITNFITTGARSINNPAFSADGWLTVINKGTNTGVACFEVTQACKMYIKQASGSTQNVKYTVAYGDGTIIKYPTQTFTDNTVTAGNLDGNKHYLFNGAVFYPGIKVITITNLADSADTLFIIEAGFEAV